MPRTRRKKTSKTSIFTQLTTYLKNSDIDWVKWRKFAIIVGFILVTAAAAWSKSDSGEAVHIARGAKAIARDARQEIDDLGHDIKSIHREVTATRSESEQINNGFAHVIDARFEDQAKKIRKLIRELRVVLEDFRQSQ